MNSMAERLKETTKTSFTSRRVPLDAMAGLSKAGGAPRPGDLVMARVTRIGHHKRLQLRSGRPSTLYVGDEIVLVYGNRYAPDQFEAVVPEGLQPCQMAAAGGIAACVLSKSDAAQAPTDIKPIGFVVGNSGQRLNLRDFALEPIKPAGNILTLGVCGTSMNAGKTTVAANLVKGLSCAGYRVAALKVTGTGAYADVNAFDDAGARQVLDFTDAGHASTFRLPASEILKIFETLVGHALRGGASAIVVEVADGFLQPETAALLTSDRFRATVDAIVFAAADSAGAVCGHDWLSANGLNIAAISGRVTISRLGMHEASAITDCPVIQTSALSKADTATQLLPYQDCAYA